MFGPTLPFQTSGRIDITVGVAPVGDRPSSLPPRSSPFVSVREAIELTRRTAAVDVNSSGHDRYLLMGHTSNYSDESADFGNFRSSETR
jgi:hypothetical protein